MECAIVEARIAYHFRGLRKERTTGSVATGAWVNVFSGLALTLLVLREAARTPALAATDGFYYNHI